MSVGALSHLTYLYDPGNYVLVVCVGTQSICVEWDSSLINRGDWLRLLEISYDFFCTNHLSAVVQQIINFLLVSHAKFKF